MSWSVPNCLDSLGVKTDEIFSDKKLIVVEEDGDVDGSFILQLLLAELNRTATVTKGQSQGHGQRALLILNSQTELHWNSVASKLGWNFNTMKDKGQLAVIDLMRKAYDYFSDNRESKPLSSSDGAGAGGDAIVQEYRNNVSDTNISKNCIFSEETGDFDLTKLISLCSSEIDKLCNNDSHPEEKGTPKLLIIIENLSNLFYCSGQSEKNVLEFLRQLRLLKRGRDIDLSVSTLVTSSEGDTRGRYFSKSISHLLATTTFQIKPLQTGFSAQVDGTISVVKQERKVKSSNQFGKSDIVINRSPKSFHYKLEDRGVRIVPLT